MSSRHSPASEGPRHAHPISKLRGVPTELRVALKRRKITTCDQLLAAAGPAGQRAALACDANLNGELLLRIVRRADLARVRGLGVVFAWMLEEVGIRDVATLARQDPPKLHERVRAYNTAERLARRSPAPKEVEDWVRQAKALPVIVTY